MSESENIALFDLDGTLADYHSKMEADLNSLRAPNEDPFKFQYDDYSNPLPPYIEARKKIISRQEGWWRSLEPFKLGLDVLHMTVALGFRLEILTKGPINKSMAWKEKVEWCADHISYQHGITITRDKSMVYGKVLVDDYPSYVSDWLKWRPRGLVIMPAHDYNEYFKHPNVIRYTGDNGHEVIRALEKAFHRKGGEEVKWSE